MKSNIALTSQAGDGAFLKHFVLSLAEFFRRRKSHGGMNGLRLALASNYPVVDPNHKDLTRCSQSDE